MILQDTSIKLQPKKRPAEDQLILDDLDDSSSNRSNYSIEDSELAQIYERTKRAKIEATIDATPAIVAEFIRRLADAM